MASKAKGMNSIVENPSWNQAQRKFFQRLGDAMPVLMSYLEDEIPLMDNHSDLQVVDETGLVKQVKKHVEKVEKAHVERLKARMGDKDSMKGSAYEAVYRGSSRIILNQEKCKEVIAAFDEEGISIERLLAALKAGQVSLTDVPQVFLADSAEAEALSESNREVFFTSAAGGRSLYVEER